MKLLLPALIALSLPVAAHADSLSITYGQSSSNPAAFNSKAETLDYVHEAGPLTSRPWITLASRFGSQDVTLGYEAWYKADAWTWHASLQGSATHVSVPHWGALLEVEHPVGTSGLVLAAGVSTSVYSGLNGTSQPTSQSAGLDYYFNDDLVGARVQQTELNGRFATVLMLHSAFELTANDKLSLYAAVGDSIEPVAAGVISIVKVRSGMLVWSHQMTHAVALQLGLGRETESPGYTSTLSQLGLSYTF